MNNKWMLALMTRWLTHDPKQVPRHYEYVGIPEVVVPNTKGVLQNYGQLVLVDCSGIAFCTVQAALEMNMPFTVPDRTPVFFKEKAIVCYPDDNPKQRHTFYVSTESDLVKLGPVLTRLFTHCQRWKASAFF